MDRIPAIKAVILKDRPVYQSVLWTAVAIVAPLLLRWLIDRGAGGIEFVTVFPAIVLASVALGWRYAAIVAVVTAIIANRLFRADPILFYDNGRDALMVGLFLITSVILIWTGEALRRLIRQQDLNETRETMLNHELMHRVKNMLATVNALAVLTARHSGPEEFTKAFTGRMAALERATNLLSVGGETRCDVHDLIEDAIAPFHDVGDFTIEGPACELPNESCVPLALALHELCTNASKYGALSVSEGNVTLLWTIGEGEEDRLRLVWQEHGGPTVKPPARKGMGTQLLRSQRGLDHVNLEFDPNGVRCEIHIDRTKPGSAPVAVHCESAATDAAPKLEVTPTP